ncbi:MAG: murein L,D-transpeptidase catalytic domain-containing protein [Flavobacterium sp.]|uniref:murein L,D-transpeptidase catalytic domain-containing protein n=1 Tax=Flavobacterium sp. TaxID=239 RepID=UPI00326794C7
MMKRIFIVLLFLLLFYWGYSSLLKNNGIAATRNLASIEATEKRMNDQLQIIKTFLQKKPAYNSDIVFLLDMKIMSGRNRFFVYDLNERKIIDQGLVAHGSGSETGIQNNLKFSNVNNSLATSLGKYSIGESYNGQFGKAYKLSGLDNSNSNAFIRNIVLHKYSKMPYEEQIEPVCNSFGCPMVNEIYFKRIEKILDTTEKPILLSIYY